MPSKYGLSTKEEQKELEIIKEDRKRKIINEIERIHPIMIDILSDIKAAMESKYKVAFEVGEGELCRNWTLGISTSKWGDYDGVKIIFRGNVNEDNDYWLFVSVKRGAGTLWPSALLIKKVIEENAKINVSAMEGNYSE